MYGSRGEHPPDTAGAPPMSPPRTCTTHSPKRSGERAASPAPVRGHRRRHGRHPERHQADRGRLHRLHRLREGRPARRDLAGEHLSRACPATSPPTSTPTPSPSTRTGATISPRARRSGPTSSVSPRSTGSSIVRFSDEVIHCTFPDGRWHLATASGRQDERRRGDRRHRRPPPPPLSRPRRARHLRRARIPQRPLGPRCDVDGRASASSVRGRPPSRSSRRSSTGSRN